MKYYLGIDGGGTKTKFIICNENLQLISQCTLGTCHYLQIGFDRLGELIKNGINTVCEEAAIHTDDIEHAFLGFAGYGDIKEDTPKIEKAVSLAMGNIPYSIGNDSENALSGALNGAPGINIIAGTGSIGYGIDESGASANCGGWHHAIGGDNGSAYWIAYKLLAEFQRQSDGRDEKTLLYDYIVSELNLASDDQLVTLIVEEWNMDRTRIASLAPICSALCERSDSYAIDIMKECAKELADYAIAIKSKLNFEGIVTVSGTGGVFKSGKYLTDEFSRILLEHGMRYQEAIHSPDIGAVLLAIKYSKQY